ncbi:hypothetical protein P483_32 [Escherichia phage P483]|uniref:Uncharacterized protein n=1 Tax=Escherichia phage P483 TaxID=1572753 RepID=A0A0D3QHF1_9CAUD|nr:hypothetical protein P483_32 [Escherichia phage P483]AJF40467.1 hypothetical protein P483_32 [Escherichia phage P483]
MVTCAVNNQNKGTFTTNKLGLKHISKRNDRELYTVCIRRNGARHVSYHKTLDEAIAARDEALS